MQSQYDLPETLRDFSRWFDSQEGILCGGEMKLCVFSVCKECIRPPYFGQHLITDAELVLVVKGKARVLPHLTEVEVQREVLQ